MYHLKRVTTAPGMLQIMGNEPGDVPGPAIGWNFWPAGSDDGPSQHHVPDWAAKAIMEDQGIAHHFECTPPWNAPGRTIDADDQVDVDKPQRKR
jgi:hypothetical protein